jgi:peroxiredoxin Q/BCP
MLKVGQRAPEFTAESSTGTTVSLADFRGRKLVLYFYPRSFTPGCTTELKRFRDNHQELRAFGADVVGVSIDSLETQCNFANTHEAKFPILADRDQRITRAYDVRWPLVPLAKRVTYIIDGEGVVRAVFHHEFQVHRHLDDVVKFLRSM